MSAEPKSCRSCGGELPADYSQPVCPKCLLEQGLESEAGKQADTVRITTDACRQPTPPSPAELAPDFPQLEIVELLGQGGMGVVYKARQRQLDRMVALKILPAEPGRDASFADRFTREARSLAKLSHPNIVAIHDFGVAGAYYYFIMEFVDGASLRQVERARRLSPAEALRIVPQVCEALQFAHEEGIVHRDIKPGNILIDKKGRVKIADFGLAKLLSKAAVDLTLTAPQQVLGTPHYMAPEQMERPQEVDHRADIYSLGVVLYEMLTGELPLGRFGPPSQKVQVDVRLDDVVLRSLEREPERRYQTVSAVKTDVDAIASTAARAEARAGVAAGGQPSEAPTDADNEGGRASGRQPSRQIYWPALLASGAVMVSAFAVGSVVHLAVKRSALSLERAAAEWRRLDGQVSPVMTNLSRTASNKHKLARLEELSTNRFLWSEPLRALFRDCTIPKIKVAQVDAAQDYVLTPASKDAHTHRLTIPATSVEKIRLRIDARDFAPAAEANYTKFMETIKDNPYFRTHLWQPAPIEFIERGPSIRMQAAEGDLQMARVFLFDCVFPDKERQ